MKTLKVGTKGKEVSRLCQLLCLPSSTEYTTEISEKVKAYQKTQGLDADGICGPKTWIELLLNQRFLFSNFTSVTSEDYEWAAEFLGCESKALKALVQVETGGKSGFDAPHKPQILFEGHVFWKSLSTLGFDPEVYASRYPSICYKSWTKKYYLGGLKEWERFDIASVISWDAAVMSTSFGLFQILGQNWKTCGASSLKDFYEGMVRDQLQQFVFGVQFLRSSGIHSALAKKDWKEVARLYNGSGQVDEYSKKLSEAYAKL